MSDGYGRCLEVGPGKVLSGLWKGVSQDISCVLAGTLDQIQEIR
jgi:hypothetical protein